MYIIGKCKKCKELLIFEFEDNDIDKAKEIALKSPIGECPGMHVEIGTYGECYEFDWNNPYEDKNEAKKELDLIIQNDRDLFWRENNDNNK